MPHPIGEKLRCDECGAEIVYTKACPCPGGDPKKHADICCGKQMRMVEAGQGAGAPGAQPGE